MTFRNFVLTWNNPPVGAEATAKDVIAMLHDKLKCFYTVGQLEAAPSTGTHHLQLYVHFDRPRRVTTFKKVSPVIHVEICRDKAAAIKYVQKEDTRIDGPYTFGKAPVEPGKVDWEFIWDCATSGNIMEIPAHQRLIHYSKIKQIAKDFSMFHSAQDDVRGVWIHGPSGVGKSKLARERYPDYYPKLCNKWWDGYSGQKAVIMDDLDPDLAKMLRQHIKLWADRYSLVLETKGGAITDSYVKFVITSQYSIEECFDDPITLSAIRRRFTVIHMDNSMIIKSKEQDERGEDAQSGF